MMPAKRRRLAYVLAAAVAALAIVVAAFPLIQEGGSGPPDGPAIVPRPIVIGLLLALPAALAAIAAFRGSRPILIAAGVLCLLQSLVGAFSGVTLGFLVPGILLLSIGLVEGSNEPPQRTQGREWLAAVLVVGLGIAAWVAPFALSETVCWIARSGPDGNLVYTIIQDTGSVTLGLDDLASGCDGGSFTLQGLMLAGVLAIGALAMAGLSRGSSRGALATRGPGPEPLP
jgi:hypothetical protein